jgi:hypothetical protein
MPAEMLSAVRDAFTLSVGDAARVFGVSRPTIYRWATLTDISQVRPHAVRERMEELYDLSEEWVRRGHLTGRWASHVLSSGDSVIDLLSAAMIDRRAIFDAHAQLIAAAGSLREAEATRSIKAARALRPAFDKLAALQVGRCICRRQR